MFPWHLLSFHGFPCLAMARGAGLCDLGGTGGLVLVSVTTMENKEWKVCVKGEKLCWLARNTGTEG